MIKQLALLFRSNTRALVLQLLFGPHRRSMYLSEICYVTGMASRSIEVELKHLRSIGILVSSPDRSRIYYSADQTHPFYPDLCNLVAKASGIEGRLREAIAVSDVLHAFISEPPASIGAQPARLFIVRQGHRDLESLVREVATAGNYNIESTILPREEILGLLKNHDRGIIDVLRKPKLFVVGREHDLTAAFAVDQAAPKLAQIEQPT